MDGLRADDPIGVESHECAPVLQKPSQARELEAVALPPQIARTLEQSDEIPGVGFGYMGGLRKGADTRRLSAWSSPVLLVETRQQKKLQHPLIARREGI